MDNYDGHIEEKRKRMYERKRMRDWYVQEKTNRLNQRKRHCAELNIVQPPAWWWEDRDDG